jgi:hypothetical protein
MSRNCRTCQHLKRPEIDRRLAAGEPVAQVARDHDLNVSSLHRHKTNCLKLGSSNEIKKEAARGSAAVALTRRKPWRRLPASSPHCQPQRGAG